MNRDEEAQTRQRAELILKVRAGLLTATQAAQELGTSRKTYYKWEKRALEGMLEGLSERKPGRPPPPAVDVEKEDLRKKVEQLEEQVNAQQRLLRLRASLMDEMKKKDLNGAG